MLQLYGCIAKFTSSLVFCRNNKKYIPYDPIPTQHELLLFSPCPRAVGILASYPRSGNSLMRTLYEHTTLRVTGSDMQGGLAKHGEWLTNSTHRSICLSNFISHVTCFALRPLTHFKISLERWPWVQIWCSL